METLVVGNVTLIHSAALTLAVIGSVTDLRSRRIPNHLVATGLALGLALNVQAAGFGGIASSLAGGVLGFTLFLPIFALGGMGGGDVKLMAAFGSLVGPIGVLRIALAAVLAGGLLALFAAWGSGRLMSTLNGVAALLWLWWCAGLRPSADLRLGNPSTLKIPYAVPIAAGTLVVALSHWS